MISGDESIYLFYDIVEILPRSSINVAESAASHHFPTLDGLGVCDTYEALHLDVQTSREIFFGSMRECDDLN